MDATLYLIVVDHAVQETLLHSRIPCNLILGLILIALVQLLDQFRRHFLKGVHLCLWEERSGRGLKAWLRMRGGFYRADPGGAVGGGATHAQIICQVVERVTGLNRIILGEEQTALNCLSSLSISPIIKILVNPSLQLALSSL